MSFEVNGTKGALKWNFERLNELELYLPTGDPAHDGYTKLLGGPSYPFHARFNPGDGIGIGYEDLKCIEAFHFLRSIVEGEQYEPSFQSALQLATVQAAMMRSWQSGGWETITALHQP
jgi:predicted dehydrogenase